jgi:glycosyltransferase involved in cell wall biosynthesis
MRHYPRILILGQPFNNITGGGITLTNLFRGWPQEQIAVAATGHLLYFAEIDICNTYYQLGEDEHRWIFPFSILQRSFPSGLKSFEKRDIVPQNRNISSLRYEFVNHVFYPFLSWLGLYHCTSRIILSERFRNWLDSYKPDMLYLQISSRETILFALQLVEYLNIPSAIHIMDDWLSTISNRGVLNKYWAKRINREFQILLDRIDVHLSISDAMSEAYEIRYNKRFIAFHNPIDLTAWMPHSKSDFKLDISNIEILYSGRIGIGIAKSLIEVASAIDKLNNGSNCIKLKIQTPTEEEAVLNMLRKFSCTVINPIVAYSELPVIFSGADILLLANDFDEQGISYLKLSMPTKASEYMISGTPIFVYAPSESAVFKAICQNECGYCLSKQGEEGIINAIRFLISDEVFRKKISRNAVVYARRSFDAEKVRSNFQNILISQSLK